MNKYYSDGALTVLKAEVGDHLPELVKQPTEVDIVRFCAAIRNFHRYHYDQAYTQAQGIPTLLVPGFLSGNWCIEAATRGFQPGVQVTGLKFRNVKMAPIGPAYRIQGQVSAVDRTAASVECHFDVKQSDTKVCVTTAHISLRLSRT